MKVKELIKMLLESSEYDEVRVLNYKKHENDMPETFFIKNVENEGDRCYIVIEL